MFKLWHRINGKWSAGVVTYRTESEAWRAMHELIEEAFGWPEDEAGIAACLAAAEDYDVRPA